MAARKLKQAETIVNQASQPAAPASGQAAQPAGQPNLVALSAAVMEAANRVTDKESRRDDIPDGFVGHVELAIVAKINGMVCRRYFDADITVGHRTTKNSSSLPNVGEIIGHILAQLNAATREAVLRDLPAIYAAHGGELPEVPMAIAEAADGLLGKLRATKQVEARGPVSVKHKEANPPLNLIA